MKTFEERNLRMILVQSDFISEFLTPRSVNCILKLMEQYVLHKDGKIKHNIKATKNGLSGNNTYFLRNSTILSVNVEVYHHSIEDENPLVGFLDASIIGYKNKRTDFEETKNEIHDMLSLVEHLEQVQK